MNLFLHLPTGAGKTRQAAEIAAQHSGKVIVLAPTVALGEEIAADWQRKLPDKTVQAHSHRSPAKKPYRAADIIVMSGERLDLLTRNWRRHWPWLSQVTLLVVDEFHTVADPVRGPALEAGVIRLRLLNPLMQVLALTATAGNPQDICTWLGHAQHVSGIQRPVPLIWEAKTTTRKEQALERALQEKPGPALVFVHSRARAMGLATQAREAGRAAAYPHAGLSAAQRREVEARYRAGDITELYCTPTLAAGVNLPAAHVALLDLSFGRGVLLSHNEVWQRAGRAGRLGLSKAGYVTLIGGATESPPRYLTPQFEPLTTAIRSPYGQSSAATEGFILGNIDGGFASSEAQISRLMSKRLGGRNEDTAVTLRELNSYGATETVQGKLRLTLLGRVSSRHLLRVSDVAFCQSLPKDPTAFDLILGAARRRAPLRITEQAAAIIEAGVQQTPSRTLDAGDDWVDPPLTASAYAAYAACLTGEKETAESLGLWESDLRLYREDLARLVQAWAELTEAAKYRLVSVMLHQAVPLEAATLTMLSGVGPKTALNWHHAGIEDVEALACLETDDERLGHMTAERREAVILQAQHLVKTFDADITREAPPSVRRSELELDIHCPFDPVRLARALQLSAEHMPGGYRVTGGHAPHFVSQDLACDCPDYRPHRPCKHVYAVQLLQCDPQTLRHAELLQ